ncbi:MAG: collagen-like protein, partial [Patescibacteria group bacterium]|nr:collagen-like protein [Patescibacteria group bacterium]
DNSGGALFYVDTNEELVVRSKLKVEKALILTPLTSNPATCNSTNKGMIYYDSTANMPKICDSSAWNDYEGPQGLQGDPGSIGLTGPEGPEGIQGIQGLQGDPGATGLQGIQGLTGLQGIQGDPGATGATGATGADGIQGLQGLQGDTGPTGVTGATGADGIQGIQGNPGSIGLTGPEGPQGPVGSEFWNGAIGGDIYSENTGNVGIGTLDPEGKLSVTGDVGIGAIANTDQASHMLDIASTKGSTGYSAIRALYPGGGGLAGTEFGALAHRESQWNAVYAKAGTGGAIALYTDGEVNMMNGNVGIGTIAPSYPLHVESGSSYAIYAETTTSYDDYAIYGKAYDDYGVYGYAAGDDYGVYGKAYDDYGVYGYAGDSYGVYGYANNNIGVRGECGAFDCYGLYTTDNLFVNGNVGIGISPSYKLDVNGSARIRKNNNVQGLLIGDDVWLGDLNVRNHLVITGAFESVDGGITFGSGKDTNIYRGGANILKTNDTFFVTKDLQMGGQRKTGWSNSPGGGGTEWTYGNSSCDEESEVGELFIEEIPTNRPVSSGATDAFLCVCLRAWGNDVTVPSYYYACLH